MKKLLALLLAATMVFAFVAGCNKDEPAKDPVKPDDGVTTPVTPPTEPVADVGPDGRVRAAVQEYRSLYSGEVVTMNYLSTGGTNELIVGANTIDSLVENDNIGNILPGSAESWSVSDDGLTWTFKIRPGQFWYDCDGNKQDPVTAHDYVAGIRYVVDAANDCSNSYLVEGWLENAEEYFAYTSAVMGGFKNAEGQYLDHDPAEDTADTKDEDKAAPVPEVKVEDIGVVAVDDTTLEYHLVIPRPYFPTVLQFGPYWPAPASLLGQLGAGYGIDNTTMWFNGAYILSTFEPQGKRIYTKNENYWDAEKVHITKITETYNAEASTLTPELFLRGDVDSCGLDSELLAEWRNDPAKSEMLAPTRVTGDYSYFMCFNFEPSFDEELDPQNWIKAVNSENFRQSIFHGLDRIKAISIQYPENATELVQNCITPVSFAVNEGRDYTSYGELAEISKRDSFDSALALEYKAKALEDLKASGAKLPIVMPIMFNSGMSEWGQECTVMEQQLEGLLGTDYIDVTVEPGTSQGFLGAVRRSGKYGFMKCNWGADYADPETWTDPFMNSSYNYAYDTTEKLEKNTKTAETTAINDEYIKLVEAAKAEYFDMDKRYEAFAKAEAFYINHAMVIPFCITGGSYQASKLNTFESQYAVFGQSSSRYKGQYVYETAMSTDMFNKQLTEWKATMGVK